ncbi:hypothetical protein [uncultured phage cr52_1]|uniref:Uncharacterized protein n=1 Tax=uncultured phage cr52_1 TaxID=2772079 RepID=A0A7M1RQC3_9CAUD|nr:hypothetical protein KNV46_gp05 [uncultured phage cr52_1]QOR56625.1 hypothetical protein [uncultured phage cr52_1]
MNKIVNANIKDDILKFEVVSDVSIVGDLIDHTIYVNECSNIDNLYSDDPELQDYVFDSTNSTITVRLIVKEGEPELVTTVYNYEISITSNKISSFDGNMKYIKMYCTTENYVSDYIDGIVYDPNTLYNAEIKMLHCYCNTCLDDKLMLKIMILVFKRQLLELAIATSHNKEAMQYYLDLTRLMGVNVSKTNEGNGCLKCINGVCSL